MCGAYGPKPPFSSGTARYRVAGAVGVEGIKVKAPATSICRHAHRQGNNNLDIVRMFRLTAVDAALLQDTGGTACPAHFYIATTSSAGAAVAQDFGLCSDNIEPAQDGEAISFSMPSFAGPAEPEAKQRPAVGEKHVFGSVAGVLTENGAVLRKP